MLSNILVLEQTEFYTDRPNKIHQNINICSCVITVILHLKSSSYQSIRIYLLAVSLTSENISEEVNRKRIYEVMFNLNLILT